MNTMSRGLIALVLVSTIVLPADVPAAGDRDPDTIRLTSAYNEFGVSLYELVVAENEGRNVFISPISISLALAMTYNGAAGGTAEEIAGALRLEGYGLDWINRSNEELIEDLGAQHQGVTLEIANSLWCRKGLRFDPLFLERTGDRFGAEARSLDFTSPGAADIINGWVSENTRGMIEGIVHEIDPMAVLFLVNAVYFKGEWKNEFDPGETKEGDFHTASGVVKKVRMMHQSGRYRYRRGEDYQAVQLPYGDGRMSMYIFLPDSASSIAAFHRRLAGGADCLDRRQFGSRKGSITMPRFRAEFETSLEALLSALGMEKVFDRREADLSGMMSAGPEEIWIDEILHKAVIEVTEKGTEAAAVTSAVVVAASISMDEPFVMILDRPFFLVIRDDQTGMMLFMGSIADPERPERDW